MDSRFTEGEWGILLGLPGVMVQMAAAADGVHLDSEFERVADWVERFAPRDPLVEAVVSAVPAASAELVGAAAVVLESLEALHAYVGDLMAVLDARLTDDERCRFLTAMWVLMFEVAKDGGFTVEERSFLLGFVDAFDLDLDRGYRLLGPEIRAPEGEV